MKMRLFVGRWAASAAVLAVALGGPGGRAHAQDAPPLDPAAPLDAMPDIGVDWPEMAADPAIPATATAAAALDASERSYAVRLDGLDALPERLTLVEAFNAQSELVRDKGQRANPAQLDVRSKADAQLLRELLRSRGYYDALVRARIDPAGGDALVVRLDADPGALYRFASVELPGVERAGAGAKGIEESFPVAAGDPVDAARVLGAEAALAETLGRRGYAGAALGEKDVVVDHESKTATLTLPVTPGPIATFGDIRVSGAPPFSARHVGTIARFRRGETYDAAKVDDLRRALVATGLVASVSVDPKASADGRVVALDVALTPAPPRTVAGELGYGTGEGFRAEASWQHRNFVNPEGALTVRAVVGTQEQGASVQLRRSNFRRRDQVATLIGGVSNIDRAAYRARTAQLGAYLERQSSFIFQKAWTYSAGAEILYSDEQDSVPATGEPRRRSFKIAALPVSLGYDGSDDLLDPQRGFRLLGRASPEFSLESGADGYLKTQLDGSLYVPVSARLVGAARARLGTIVGAARDSIAPSRRFYAGGGGSVRGYGYQQVGPIDASGDPIGGKSLAEISLEARVRLGNFGIVPFLDGGMVSPGGLPRLSDFQFGAGLGLRYYSSFGPIRVDVGTPLDRRPGDSRIAVAVSLGQAF